jgi:heme oxygenase
MTLLERLKIETREAHDRIENAIDLDRRIASREAYRGC